MLIFVDGFDYYPTVDITKKWSSLFSDASDTVICSAGGRYGSGTQKLDMGSFGGGAVTKVLARTVQPIVGFAFKWAATGTSVITLVKFKSDAINQGQLNFNAGILTYTNGSRASYSLASLTSVLPNTWNYIEFKSKFETSSTSGSTQVRLNGAVVIDVPIGTNTLGDFFGGPASANAVQFGHGATGVTGLTVYYDDIYVADNTGSSNNDFLGDVRIETIYPDGAGSSSDFTPVSGANYTNVNETSEDGDTSYVSGNTVGNKDIYTYADLVSSPTQIFGIQISTIARKDDAGVRKLTSVVKSGGTEYDHSSTNPFGLGDSYTQHLDMWEKDPNGSIAWTDSSINALNAGFKVVN